MHCEKRAMVPPAPACFALFKRRNHTLAKPWVTAWKLIVHWCHSISGQSKSTPLPISHHHVLAVNTICGLKLDFFCNNVCNCASKSWLKHQRSGSSLTELYTRQIGT
ncbi:hypothetical protein LINPERPRIM_LOCUS8909 [Linum perenne]